MITDAISVVEPQRFSTAVSKKAPFAVPIVAAIISRS